VSDLEKARVQVEQLQVVPEEVRYLRWAKQSRLAQGRRAVAQEQR
jgi:hypothetical protein